MTQDELALELANKALSKGFDPEAYIVKHIAEQRVSNKKQYDLVPDSNIDECIKLMLDLFVSYHKYQTVENLTEFLTVQKQVLSELYHSCNDERCKETMKTFFTSMQNII